MTERSDSNIEAGLREIFAHEIRSQQGQTPSFGLVRLMARIEARERIEARVERIRVWSETAAVGAIAGLLATFWNQMASGLEAFLPLSQHHLSWASVLGLSASVLALFLCWPKAFNQDV